MTSLKRPRKGSELPANFTQLKNPPCISAISRRREGHQIFTTAARRCIGRDPDAGIPISSQQLQPARKYLAGAGGVTLAAALAPQLPATAERLFLSPVSAVKRKRARALVRSDFCPSASVRFTTLAEGPAGAGPGVPA
jgi:hypothetical protein